MSARPWRLAAAIAVFLVAATLPYLWLIEHFGYDDILREPAAQVLTSLQAGGPPLVAAWLAFAMASLLVIPVALALHALAPGGGRRGVRVVGEMVGPLLMARWTAGAVLQPWRQRAVPRWLSAAGALTMPLWLLGQTELLYPVLPAARNCQPRIRSPSAAAPAACPAATFNTFCVLPRVPHPYL